MQGLDSLLIMDSRLDLAQLLSGAFLFAVEIWKGICYWNSLNAAQEA